MPKPLAAVSAVALALSLSACSLFQGDDTVYGIDRQGGLNLNQSQTKGQGAVQDQGVDVQGGGG